MRESSALGCSDSPRFVTKRARMSEKSHFGSCQQLYARKRARGKAKERTSDKQARKSLPSCGRQPAVRYSGPLNTKVSFFPFCPLSGDTSLLLLLILPCLVVCYRQIFTDLTLSSTHTGRQRTTPFSGVNDFITIHNS